MTVVFALVCLVLARTLAIGAAARDVSMQISADAINSAGSVYAAAGVLSASGAVPDNVTTSVLKTLVPKAYAACPDCPLSFTVFATSAPVVTITEANGAVLVAENVVLNLTAAHAVPPGAAVPLLTLGLNATCGLNFSDAPLASGDYLKPTISILKLHLVVESSQVGILPSAAIALLDPLVNGFLKSVAIPYFNRVFPGFPLPSVTGFPISDFIISHSDGYLGVGLDITPQQQNLPPPPKTASVEKLLNETSRKPTVGPVRISRKLISRRYLANPPGFSGPGVVATVGGTGLDKILASLLPKIVSKVNGLTIPAMSGKASGVSYSVDAITLAGFAIGSSSITFSENKGLVLALGGLTLQVPSTGFKIKKKVLFAKLSCSGHFHGGLANTGVRMNLNLTAVEPAGSPEINPTSSWSWGNLDVSVKMDHTICRIIKDIASWFVGNINHKIEDVIKQIVPKTVQNLISTEGNEILQNLVLSKNIDKHADVNFYLTQNPTSADDAISVYLSGQFVPAKSGQQ
jgi:hypothetical protein